ncbi:MAG: polyamine aminopropyltransferase [Alphaproteobacteria bacterium]
MTWVWFDDTLEEGYRLGLKIEETLYEESSEHQRLAIYQSANFGRVLSLDGIVQTTEGDEFIYHEMLTHIPILAHGKVREVAIIGGGDGGSLREVLKHPIDRATMIEIDPHVVELCRTYMPSLSAGAFDDPRTDLVIADGARYVAETDRRFDVLIIDSTDPIGPAEILFSEGFYRDCRRCLAPGGILVTQNGVPMVQPQELTTSYRRLSAIFADVTCYLAPVPTYFGGAMAFGWATDDPAKRRVTTAEIAKRFAAANFATRYYLPDIHRPAFALPRCIADLLH